MQIAVSFDEYNLLLRLIRPQHVLGRDRARNRAILIECEFLELIGFLGLLALIRIQKIDALNNLGLLTGAGERCQAVAVEHEAAGGLGVDVND